ncbi:MAG: hypothetical protein ACRDSE_16980 [Pseudonocardiaceae bacterium]
MTWYRDKSPELIRDGALTMIARKVRGGCASCADAYVELARRYGADEDDIARALALPTAGKDRASGTGR